MSTALRCARPGRSRFGFGLAGSGVRVRAGRRSLARACSLAFGFATETWPPTAVIVMMTGIARYLLIEEAFDVRLGHAETVALVERNTRELEGEREPIDEDVLATGVS